MKHILNAGNHTVTVTDKPGEALNAVLAEMTPAAGRVFVLCDEHTSRLCYPVIEADLPHNTLRIVTGAGERNKTIDAATVIWEFLLAHGANRDAVMLNLGGGLVTDLGGFAASLFKRGIRFINLPTSLLGMVDASCGGKTGVDLNQYKNMVGMFSVPHEVIVSPVFLSTLPEAEWRNGMAEVMKHGLISDAALWSSVKSVIETKPLLHHNQWPVLDWIEKAIAVKAEIVSRDPYEKNERKLLNFGHTVGHAIETHSLQNDDMPISHGMAVAVGMICESFLSTRLTGLHETQLDEITRTIVHLFRPAILPKESLTDIFHIMHADKKATSGTLTFALLKETGSAIVHQGISTELLFDSFHYFNSKVA